MCVCARVYEHVSATAAEGRRGVIQGCVPDGELSPSPTVTLSLSQAHLVLSIQRYLRYFSHIPRSSTLHFVVNLSREPGCWHKAQATAIEYDWSYSGATSGHAGLGPNRQLVLRMGREGPTAFKYGINQQTGLSS